jgi:hypothetical protein
VEVTRTKTSPARIQFRVTDSEGDPAAVEILMRAGSRVEDALLVADAGQGIDVSLDGLATDGDGVEHVKLWDFDTQLGTGFVPGVELSVSLRGTDTVFRAVGNGVGNDPPSIVLAEPVPVEEVVGLAQFELSVGDSSSDIVAVAASFSTDVAGGFPEGSFQPASPADAGLVGVVTDDGGAPDGAALADFFWDVIADLGTSENRVRMRFVPTDCDEDGSSLATGEPLEVEVTVDNNSEPIADLDETSFVLDGDRRRGLPVPFRVINQEPGESVELVFQWRHPEQSFDAPPLELPGSAAEIRVLLRSPLQAQLHQIAERMPIVHAGRLVPLGPDRVRLPELALGAESLETHGLIGRVLEVGRVSLTPSLVSQSWSTPPSRPAAALPDATGAEAYVLDRASSSALRLRRIELATGAVLDERVASAPGIPDAMAWDVGGEALLIASHDFAGEAWTLQRLSHSDPNAPLETLGTFTASVALSDPDSGSLVRGLASLGAASAVATIGSDLWRIDYPRSPATLHRLLGNLEEPTGVAVDVLAPARIFLAERRANRVLEVDPETGASHVLAASLTSVPPFLGGGFPAPEALAYDSIRRQLLVVTDPVAGDGAREIRSVATTGGSPLVVPLGTVGTDTPATGELVGTGLALAESGAMVVSLRLEDEIAAGGGAQQLRTVTAVDTATNSVTVDRPFDPPLDAEHPWRIEELSDPLIASSSGVRGTFLWDVSRVTAGNVFVRMIAIDSEPGIRSDTQVPKTLAAPFGATRAHFSEPERELELADLDEDGLLDLVFARPALQIRLQDTPRAFGPVTTLPGFARSVAAGDLNGDGLRDLAALGNQIDLYFNAPAAPGSFATVPDRSLSGITLTFGQTTLVVDLNGDGFHDVYGGGVVFLQDPNSPGSFPGKFGEPDHILIGGLAEVAAGDLDGDGSTDLVLADDEDLDLSVFLQTPGGFSLVRHLVDALTGSVDLADLDRDGDLDLVAAGFDPRLGQAIPDGVALIFLQEQGGLSLHERLGLDVMDGTRAARAADFDRDGWMDVAVYSSEYFNLFEAEGIAPNVQFFHQIPSAGGPPRFRRAEHAQLRLASSPGSAKSVSTVLAAADIDSDGYVDVAAPFLEGFADGVDVYYQAGRGGFLAEPGGLHFDPSIPFTSLGLGDLDGDGLQELFGGDSLAFFGRARILRQTTLGRFTFGEILAGSDTARPFTPARFSVADVDDDDRVDIILANGGDGDSGRHGSADVSVFTAGSAGFTLTEHYNPFTQFAGFPGGTFDSDVLAQDLDADGKIDLAVGVTIGLGGRTFLGVRLRGRDLEVALDAHAESVAAGDLDRDGLQDLAAAGAGSGLVVFLQNAPGDFGVDPGSEEPRLPSLVLTDAAMNDPSSSALADFDGNGQLDLLAACRGSANLVVFLQRDDGDGELESTDFTVSSFDGGGSLEALHALDLDLDGDLDALARRGNDLASFLQTAPGRFTPDPDSPLFSGLPDDSFPVDFVVGDIDGDRDADVLVRSGTALQILYGRH